jgi:D-tyrosyl-tRNA(Tyr) deacylase
MLVVSQFTLLGDCRKGRRPSFVHAEDPNEARILYEYFVVQGKEKMNRVYGGEFHVMMKIDMVNDGPVTLLLDSKRIF